MLVTQAHRNNDSYCYLDLLSRAARTLGGGGSSAHIAVAMGSRVVGSSQRHVLGGVVEDTPPIAPLRENAKARRIGQGGGHSYAAEACITHSDILGQETLEVGGNWRVLGLASDAQLSLTLNLGCGSCLVWYSLGPSYEGAMGWLVLDVWSSRPLAHSFLSPRLLYIYRIRESQIHES